jgi:Protein of unknown function (DUF3617)
MHARTLAAAAIAAGLTLAAASAAAQQPDIRPGLWELNISGTRDIRQNVCITPALAKDMKQMAAKGDPSSDCKVSNEKSSGNTRSMDIACTKPAVYRAHVTITVDGPDRFTMAQEYAMERGEKSASGKMVMTYRRIGECKQ